VISVFALTLTTADESKRVVTTACGPSSGANDDQHLARNGSTCTFRYVERAFSHLALINAAVHSTTY